MRSELRCCADLHPWERMGVWSTSAIWPRRHGKMCVLLRQVLRFRRGSGHEHSTEHLQKSELVPDSVLCGRVRHRNKFLGAGKGMQGLLLEPSAYLLKEAHTIQERMQFPNATLACKKPASSLRENTSLSIENLLVMEGAGVSAL
jgi:hypothetical protein